MKILTMKTDAMFADLRRWFEEYGSPERGITGFRSWRFWLALLSALTAFLVLARDPLFLQDGAFYYQQGVICLLMAFVLTAALNWEMLLFGPPRGANLLMQFALCLPMSILIARITAGGITPEPASQASVLGFVSSSAQKISNLIGIGKLLSGIPVWILDLFRHWQTTAVFLLAMLALSFKSTGVRISLLFLLFAVGLFSVISAGDDCTMLIAGMILTAAAMALMFNPCDRLMYYENAVRALSVKPIDPVELRTILRIVTAARGEQKLSEKSLHAIVKSEYSAVSGGLDGSRLRTISGLITEKLLYEYQLMHLEGDRDGIRLTPDPRLSRCDSLLRGLSVWPRVVFVGLIAAVWTLLPIDLIPDGIPFVGMLDDVSVAMLSMWCIRNAVKE